VVHLHLEPPHSQHDIAGGANCHSVHIGGPCQ
jgi:hypothetical protein